MFGILLIWAKLSDNLLVKQAVKKTVRILLDSEILKINGVKSLFTYFLALVVRSIKQSSFEYLTVSKTLQFYYRHYNDEFNKPESLC
ncbi:hypothetical protein BpHYR1_011258 [Brachionus plicatilis]|uniref:Uncharacterized protein n=1 Tax=Brachionus plicatilis TaxID=10195 RepID=A0A3M7RCJ2_BRAPC|nr:hypothetical protein BpHYR1_011258 [Brachionus plicatilis]